MSIGKQLAGLIGWLILVYLAAAIGGFGSANAPVFYRELTLPGWAPPAWLFGPVWTALYTMMGVAAWLVWRQDGYQGTAKPALQIFLIQLGLNAIWSWLFFGFYLGLIAFIEIIALWAFILATIVLFWRQRKAAALLLVPYFIWVTFAAALSYQIWQLNPQAL
ncbi:TspO/MBR family protein [Pseudidiomarina sp.]|uniref:TspO/MBR family protein n=1 Tax=Pseudidiomarina sp. TaxID=2081707 RepID=UPI00299F0998|nr:TspO/MBR family protein [Pseudidiomarina sp.]MDX1706199.1 TspO/MBR family protein [Pseudidiomarina sp.]